MTTSAKAHAKKHPRHTSQAAGRSTGHQQSSAEDVTEEGDAPLVNSPYSLFAPILEMVTSPWRLFFPFAPWPTRPKRQPRK